MTVLVFENNLIWSSRLLKSIKALGHTGKLHDPSDSEPWKAQAAIVNLSNPDPERLVCELRNAGVYVIGHAGHKERNLLEEGRAAGCNRIASNSELTYKLDTLLQEIPT